MYLHMPLRILIAPSILSGSKGQIILNILLKCLAPLIIESGCNRGSAV